MSFLSKVQLFKKLPRDNHPLLAAVCVQIQFKEKEVIIREGDVGDAFFVIRSGEASVTQKEKTERVAKLQKGDYFGEAALLHDEQRNATITAITELSALKITRERFQELNLHEKLVFANRRAVGGGGREVLVKPPSEKTPEEKRLIRKALNENDALVEMVELDEVRIEHMVDVFWKETIEEGGEIIKEGDLQADYFYIVEDGMFDVFVSEELPISQDGLETEVTEVSPSGLESPSESESPSRTKHLNVISKGGCFGELALLYHAPRAATVVAKTTASVWVIDRNNFKSILMKASDKQIEEYMKLLTKVEILNPLLMEERKALAGALKDQRFSLGDKIMKQGDEGSTFYILYDGEVIVVKDGKEVNKLKAGGSRGDRPFFGEAALLCDDRRNATIQVTSPTAKVLVLHREMFNALLGPLKEIMTSQQGAPADRTSALKKKAQGSLNPARTRIFRRELGKVGLLGCGGFGCVELFVHKNTGNTFAMKQISKGYVVKMGMQECVMNEKNILMMTNSPFIIKLYECYNGSQMLYFLMEPALGGELYATYRIKGLTGSVQHAHFYVAGVVYAFEHLHERYIIYRDLKPENLLLDEQGQLKVTDMGLAKFVIGKTYTTCGTPDYFAPELIHSSGHTTAVDWWTLGILIFELMSGHPPFAAPNTVDIYQKIVKGINKVAFPLKCLGEVGELIRALLKKEPSERLPMRACGLKGLKGHNWFSGFDWETMAEGRLAAPYKPKVKSKRDIANFTARPEDMPKKLEYKDNGSGWDKDFAT